MLLNKHATLLLIESPAPMPSIFPLQRIELLPAQFPSIPGKQFFNLQKTVTEVILQAIFPVYREILLTKV